MKKQTVTKNQDIFNISDNTFIFNKQTGKGFIKRNLSELGVGSYIFDEVVETLEKRSAQDLINLKMDPHIFVDGIPVMSNILAKKALKEVENLSDLSKTNMLKTKYQYENLIGYEKQIKLISVKQSNENTNSNHFYTIIDLLGKSISVSDDSGLTWSEYFNVTNITNNIPYKVIIPNGIVSNNITNVKVNLFDTVVTGEINNINLSTPTLTTNISSTFIGEEITFNVNTTETNFSSIYWEISGEYTIVSGQLTNSKNTSVTIISNNATSINVKVKLIGMSLTESVRYLTSEFSEEKVVIVEQPIKLTTPSFTTSSNSLSIGESLTLTANMELPGYNSVYEWDIVGVYNGTVSNGYIQTITPTVDGQIQVRLRVVKNEIGYINSDWSNPQYITVITNMVGPLQFNDSNNTEPPSFIEGEIFYENNPGVDTTDNISIYM